jgi:hypothetical protein
VRDLPLSRAPEDLAAAIDWTGLVSALAVGLTVAAVLANRFLTWPAGLLVGLVLLVLDLGLRRKHGTGGPGNGSSRPGISESGV